jgi:serine/threonine protein kinase
LVGFAEGIAFFNGKNYTHLDIKAPNMLITDTDNRPILIDFGLSIFKDEIYTMDSSTWLLNSDYPYYPPEFRICMMHIGRKNKKTEDYKAEQIGIYTKLNEKDEKNGIGTQIYNRMSKYYDQTLIDIEKLIDTTKINDLYENYEGAFASKVDVFSFGIVILMTMHFISKKFSNPLLDRCMKIGEDASHINPIERINIDQVVQQLKELLADSEKYSDTTLNPQGGSTSLKDLKDHLKGLKCEQLYNLVDKYKMKPNLKKLNKDLLSNALAEHIILHKKNQKTIPKKNVPKTPIKKTPIKKTLK